MTVKKIALFIDADNISAKFGKQIFDALERRGEIFIRRIYGNWEKLSLHGWNDCILNYSLRAVQQPDFATGKNATDMSLTIDAMDVLHDGKAEIFALVSNDSDFTPLAIRLREGGMNVIGLGSAQVSNSFRAACSEFIDLSAQIEVQPVVQPPPKVVKKFSAAQEKISSVQLSLFDEDKAVEPETPPATLPTEIVPATVATSPKVIPIDDRKLQSERDKKIQLVHNTLHESAAAHADATGFLSINYARQDLKNKNFGFTVRDFGYGQLKEFIVAFPKLYESRQDDSGQNFCYRCRNVEQKNSDAIQNQIHDVLREAAALHEDADGFVNLWWACELIGKKKNLCREVKSFSHKDLTAFISAAPDLYEAAQMGGDFCYRCRNVKQEILDDNDRLQRLHTILQETAKVHGDEKGFATLSWAGDAIGKKNLSIKGSGHGTLSKFIAAFPNLYEVKQSGGAFCYRCLAAAPKSSAAKDKFKPIHDILREVATAYTDLNDAGGYTALNRAGLKAHERKLDIKSFGYSSWSKFVADFPNRYAVKKVGSLVYYRCR